jgi:hypothetical protein
MSGPTDRTDDPNIVARGEWVTRISEAAGEFAPGHAPEQSRESSSGSTITVSYTSLPLSRNKSLKSTFHPAAASQFRGRSKLAVCGGVITITASLVIAAAIAMGELQPTDIWRQLGIDRSTELASSLSRPAQLNSEQATPRLMVQPSHGSSEVPVPLGVALRGRAVGAVVIIRGLVPGTELSVGKPVGTDAWQLPASDLGAAWIAPPRSFVGSTDLVFELRLSDDRMADRQTVQFNWSPISSPSGQFQEIATDPLLDRPPKEEQPEKALAGSSIAPPKVDHDSESAGSRLSPPPMRKPGLIAAEGRRRRDAFWQLAGAAATLQLSPPTTQFQPDEIVAEQPISPPLTNRQLADAAAGPSLPPPPEESHPKQIVAGSQPAPLATIRLEELNAGQSSATPLSERQLAEAAAALPDLPSPSQFQPEEIVAGPTTSPPLKDRLLEEPAARLPIPKQIEVRSSPSSERQPEGPASKPSISPLPPQFLAVPNATVPPIPPPPAEHQLDGTRAAPPIAPPPPAQRKLDQEEIAVLLKRGKDLIANGDLAAARLVLQRAANANDAEAALALGATYDPYVLRALKVYGFKADPVMARVWYEKATELGSAAAPRRLEMLTSGMR